MEGRKQTDFKSTSMEKGYTGTDAIRGALNTTALGLGISENISKEISFYTTATVETVAATLGLIVVAHEMVELIKDYKNYEYGRSIHLLFRMAFIIMSYVGAAMLYNAAKTKTTNSPESAIGLALIGLSIFGSRWLSGAKAKNSLKVEKNKKLNKEKDEVETSDHEKNSDDENKESDIEMQEQSSKRSKKGR